jgi:phage repressor protein C with HTH and peptisase S24 domain
VVSTIYNYLKGKPSPPILFLQKLAKGANVRAEWLVLGIPPETTDDDSGDWETHLPPPVSGQTRIPIQDIVASAGDGRQVLSESALGFASFPSAFLRTLGSSVDLSIIKVDGDSMEPELRSGELVMINCGQRELREGLFVIRYGDQLLIKRLHRIGAARIELSSANPLYRPITVDLATAPDFEIIGRAVWTGRTLG